MAARGGSVDKEIQHGAKAAGGQLGHNWMPNTHAAWARRDRQARWIADNCGLTCGDQVLELGCGTGWLTRGLVNFGCTVTAIDVSPDLIAVAQSRTSNSVRFHVADLETSCGPKSLTYDAVCGVGILHHVDLDKALPLIYARLRLGARFAFCEPNILNPLALLVYNVEHFRRLWGVVETERPFHRSELVQSFQRHGFVVNDCLYRDFLHPKTPAAFVPVAEILGMTCEHIPLLKRLAGSLWIYGRAE